MISWSFKKGFVDYEPSKRSVLYSDLLPVTRHHATRHRGAYIVQKSLYKKSDSLPLK